MKRWMAVLMLVPAVALAAVIKKPTESPFYVYKDGSTPQSNHYIPSGWMGDFSSLKYNPRSVVSKDNTCIEIKYSAEQKEGNGWAGIYWQDPANNWATMKGGYDLSAYSKLVFKVRGARGGEVIDKFIFGNISSATEEGDTDSAFLPDVTLGESWKEYTIDVKSLDKTHIIGGFGFAVSADHNPAGMTFYLDEIRFEK